MNGDCILGMTACREQRERKAIPAERQGRMSRNA